jgi:hypothetical protein
MAKDDLSDSGSKALDALNRFLRYSSGLDGVRWFYRSANS